nr:glycoside hydrolase family 3 protein [Actinoplanes sp. TBRC 11911]
MGAPEEAGMPLRRAIAALSGSALVLALIPGTAVAARPLPYEDSRQPVERRVADLLSRMTLAEKIGQMTQAERGAVTGDPSLIAQWRLGSVLSGGGSFPTPNTPAAWVAMVNQFQSQALSTRLHIPLIYGIDAVHGHGTVYGATVFPHNVGMGATRDPGLVERAYGITGDELRATGIPWDFAPCICVARDERWGRTYESFSEDPALVIRMEPAIDGLHSKGVLATAKHYAGDGDTEYGSSSSGDFTIDQGVTVTNRRDFARIDLSPYVTAVRDHHVGSVMPSFSSVDWTEDGAGNPIKMHANRELITDELKHRMGFDGFVITDWEGVHQIPDPGAPAETGLTGYKVRVAVNAGSDMFMEPNSALPFEQLLTAEVTAGRVGMSRIDDAVRRILRTKFRLGLFEHPYASTTGLDRVGSTAHRAVARQAVAESQVLLKNQGSVLPLRRDAKVYVAGRNADNIGNQAGGWTLQWQGVSGADVIPGTSILDGIRQTAPRVTYSADASAPTTGSDVGIVVVGETPYAEGFGDVGASSWPYGTPEQLEPKSLSLQPGDRAVIDKVCAAIAKCVVLIVSGRPQIITDQLGEIDSLVASWLPGSEGGGVADVLFGARPFTGRLPMSWPRTEAQVPINVGDKIYQPLFPYGWGLRTDPGRNRLAAAGSATTDARLSVLRDAAQAHVVAGRAASGWQAKLADADHAQATGDDRRAAALLTEVIRS